MYYSLDNLIVRRARPDDAPVLARLAALDGAAPLEGDALVAEAGGEPVAAVAMEGDRVVADPFVRTADTVALLRLRAAQLRGNAPSGRRRGRRVIAALGLS